MIEIICNGEDDSNKGNMRGNADIRRPKNIKQIGDVSSNRKIYIEDYAFTYINSVAYQTPEDEQEHMDGQSHKILADAIYRKLEAEIL